MKTLSLSFFLSIGVLTASRSFVLAAESGEKSDTVMGIRKSELAPSFSRGVNEVAKLARSGVDESVVIAFVFTGTV